MTFRIVTPPTEEPISLDLARRHCRITPDDDSPPFHPDDAWLEQIGIPAAREYCERFLMRALAPQTVEVILDAFPTAGVQLPYSPVTSITSVKYVDGDAVEQTLLSGLYVLDSFQEPSWVLPLINTDWPTTYGAINSVKVRYTAGYDDDHPMPFSIKAAILLMIGHLYENREATNLITGLGVQELPLGVQSLLIPYQLRMSMA